MERLCPRISRIGLGMLLGVTLSACGAMPGYGNTFGWKEEVVLHGGDTIIVKRKQTFDPHGLREPGQGAPLSEETLAFSLHDGRAIRWRSNFGRGYQDNLMPLALDVVDGSPYLITYPTRCHAYNKWGRPNPPYVFFRYSGSQWQRIPLEEVPAVLDHANLIIGGYESRWRQLAEADRDATYVPAKSVQKVNREMTHDSLYLRQFARQPMKGGPTGCEQLVQDGNGGWLSPDWFWRQSNIDACLRMCARKRISAEFCLCRKYFKAGE